MVLQLWRLFARLLWGSSSFEEQIIIQKPDIAPGDLALSYNGGNNEVADLWLENATLDDRSQHLLFPNLRAPAPGRISYTTGEAAAPTNSGDACHTTIEIRRAKDSTPLDALTLYQTDEMAGAQRYRQVILNAGTSALEIEVHTDSPDPSPAGLLGCHKVLTVGDSKPIQLPAIPVHMLVQRGVWSWAETPKDTSSASDPEKNLRPAALKDEQAVMKPSQP